MCAYSSSFCTDELLLQLWDYLCTDLPSPFFVIWTCHSRWRPCHTALYCCLLNTITNLHRKSVFNQKFLQVMTVLFLLLVKLQADWIASAVAETVICCFAGQLSACRANWRVKFKCISKNCCLWRSASWYIILYLISDGC